MYFLCLSVVAFLYLNSCISIFLAKLVEKQPNINGTLIFLFTYRCLQEKMAEELHQIGNGIVSRLFWPVPSLNFDSELSWEQTPIILVTYHVPSKYQLQY